MFLPLALVLSAVLILGTTGSVIKQTSGVSVQKDDVFPGIGQYLYNAQFRNWTDAIKFCETNRGELVVINSEAEKNAVKIMMAKHGATSVQVGAHALYTEGSYVTIHDEPLLTSCGGVSQWAPNYPTGSAGSNCVIFQKEGYLDTRCNNWASTICEYPQSGEYDVIPEVGRYKYHTDNITWPEARAACEAEGAHLYVINSKVEREAVFDKYNYSQVWVGVHRLFSTPDTSEDFVDIFNNKVATKEAGFWYPGWPSGTVKTKPYVAIYKSGPNSHFTQLANSGLAFICEMHL